MPITLVFAIILLVATAVSLFVHATVDAPTRTMLWVRTGLAATAFLLLLSSSYNPVSTKNEGVETSFGKPVGHLHNGPHLTWPWIKVHEMDAAIQTDSYTEKQGDPLTVRIANQQIGYLDISIRWRICTAASSRPASVTERQWSQTKHCTANAVDDLFRDYRTFEHVRNSLVTRELSAAANEAFATYNPLDSIKLGTASNGVNNPLLAKLANTITEKMRAEIGDQIEVLNTIIPVAHYDDATQARINQLQQQVALTRIAEQARLTNAAQAKANDALAKSVNTSPNVLVDKCLSVLEAMVKASQNVPAGFSCWPGGGVAGVIAGPTPSK